MGWLHELARCFLDEITVGSAAPVHFEVLLGLAVVVLCQSVGWSTWHVQCGCAEWRLVLLNMGHMDMFL